MQEEGTIGNRKFSYLCWELQECSGHIYCSPNISCADYLKHGYFSVPTIHVSVYTKNYCGIYLRKVCTNSTVYIFCYSSVDTAKDKISKLKHLLLEDRA